MSYQPNDFVNPHHRGVELAAGCKDLNQLVKNTPAQKQVSRPVFPIRRGGLKDVPGYLQSLYMDHYGSSLVVIIRAAEAILSVQNRYGGPRVALVQRKQRPMLEPAVQDLFTNLGFQQEADENTKVLSAPLPNLWLEAAQILEKVIRAYALSDDVDLLFYFVRQAE